MSILSAIFGRSGKSTANTTGLTSADALRREVMLRLGKHPPIRDIEPTPDDPESISLIFGENPSKRVLVYLGNLRGNLATMEQVDHSAEIERFLASVLASFEGNPPLNAANIFINIRPRDYLTAEPPETDGETVVDPMLFADLPGDIIEVYSSHVPGGLILLHASDIGDTPQADIRQSGLRNVAALVADVADTLSLMAAPPDNQQSGGGAVLVASRFEIDSNPDVSPGLLLVDEFWEKLVGLYPEGAVVAIPCRNSVIAVSRKVQDAITMARQLIEQEQEEQQSYLLSDLVFERRDGKLAVVQE